MPGSITIEPLNADHHDRAAFSSGVEPVDNFLHRTAGKLMKGGTARVFVAVDPENSPQTILGFYAINAHSVEYKDLPGRYKRYSLPDGTIPAAFIGMMGVTKEAQGQGLRSLLLADALKGAYSASHRVGTAIVVLDVLDCGDPSATCRRRQFYEGFGFTSLPSRPLRMFLPVSTIANAL